MADVERRALDPDLAAARTIDVGQQLGVGLTRGLVSTGVFRTSSARPESSDRQAAPAGGLMLFDAADGAGGVLAPFLVEVELLQGRLVAGDEQEQRLLGGGIVVLEPEPPGMASVSNSFQS